MQTIIVEVYLPATSESYDFRLPAQGRIGDICREMVRILESTRQNLLIDAEYPLLCERDAGKVLPDWQTVGEAGLRDGSRLLLL